MFKKLTTLLTLTSSLALASTDKVVLTKDNYVVLESEVNSQSAGTASHELILRDKSLKKGEPIYLVLETPGGSVVDGQNLINVIHGLDHEVKTITYFAASMGFQIVQAAGERLVTESGVLMSHRAAGSVQGEYYGSLENRKALWTQIVDQSDTTASKRLKISLKKYRDLVHDEYWVTGQKSVDDNSADRIITVTCDDTLTGTRVQVVQTMFGNVQVLRSMCPAVRGFLDVKAEATDSEHSKEFSAEQHNIMTWLMDREGFVRKFILNNNQSKL